MSVETYRGALDYRVSLIRSAPNLGLTGAGSSYTVQFDAADRLGKRKRAPARVSTLGSRGEIMADLSARGLSLAAQAAKRPHRLPFRELGAWRR
jgi:hypothetical protein